jgi:hypothetical protein
MALLAKLNLDFKPLLFLLLVCNQITTNISVANRRFYLLQSAGGGHGGYTMNYQCPSTLKQCLESLSRNNFILIAGGTDLFIKLEDLDSSKDKFMDLSNLSLNCQQSSGAKTRSHLSPCLF